MGSGGMGEGRWGAHVPQPDQTPSPRPALADASPRSLAAPEAPLTPGASRVIGEGLSLRSDVPWRTLVQNFREQLGEFLLGGEAEL